VGEKWSHPKKREKIRGGPRDGFVWSLRPINLGKEGNLPVSGECRSLLDSSRALLGKRKFTPLNSKPTSYGRRQEPELSRGSPFLLGKGGPHYRKGEVSESSGDVLKLLTGSRRKEKGS